MTDLLIPDEGPMQAWEEGSLDGSEVQVNLTFTSDLTPPVKAVLTMLGLPNLRAQRAMLLLAGVHIVLVGPVLFRDLDEDMIRAIVEDIEGLV